MLLEVFINKWLNMNTDKNFQFIINKITEINIALFHCQTTSLLKIPTTIVTPYRVDEDGNILFFLQRPKQLISQFEKDFPVELNFFKKGLNYYLNVSGFARIINDPEELYAHDLTFDEMELALNKSVLVKVKILKADYFENDINKRNSIINKMRSFVYNMLEWVEPNAKTFDFRSNPQIHNYGF
jgi:hypothetical protein